MRAASLLAKGLSQSEVARRVGAHRQSVSKWAAELEAKGACRAEAGWPRRTQTAIECGADQPDRGRAQTRAASAGV